jgi:membrane-bound ClpP family serine protease
MLSRERIILKSINLPKPRLFLWTLPQIIRNPFPFPLPSNILPAISLHDGASPMVSQATTYTGFVNPGQYWDTLYTAAALVIIIVAAVLIFALAKSIQLRLKPPQVAPLVEGEKVVPGEDAGSDVETFVMYRGEYWKARSPKGIAKGKAYRITGKDGTVLILEPIE